MTCQFIGSSATPPFGRTEMGGRVNVDIVDSRTESGMIPGTPVGDPDTASGQRWPTRTGKTGPGHPDGSMTEVSP
jgi:hypothetical protein